MIRPSDKKSDPRFVLVQHIGLSGKLQNLFLYPKETSLFENRVHTNKKNMFRDHFDLETTIHWGIPTRGFPVAQAAVLQRQGSWLFGRLPINADETRQLYDA